MERVALCPSLVEAAQFNRVESLSSAVSVNFLSNFDHFMTKSTIMDRLDALKLVNWIILPVWFLYFFCMFIYPFIVLGWRWDEVQGVWARWQGINAGMLALLSSIIAFNIGINKAERQRKRDFIVSIAFLPDALSKLSAYLSASALVLDKAWEKPEKSAPLNITPPVYPSEVKEVFGNCIRDADYHVGEYLSGILKRLQIHEARLEKFFPRETDRTFESISKPQIIDYIYRLGQLKGMIDRVFPFSRGQPELDTSPLIWDDFKNAYGALDLWYEDYSIKEGSMKEEYSLEKVTRARLDRPDPMG